MTNLLTYKFSESCEETLCSQWEIVTHSQNFSGSNLEKKDTLLVLENEHCLKMISVDATINGSVSDVTGGPVNSTIMDISHAFYHFKWVYLCKY